MKINRLTLPIGKEERYLEDIDFSSYQGDEYHVRRILSCHMDLRVTNYDDLLILSFKIKGEVETTCAYTLEKFAYPYDIKETIELNNDEKDDFIIDSNAL